MAIRVLDYQLEPATTPDVAEEPTPSDAEAPEAGSELPSDADTDSSAEVSADAEVKVDVDGADDITDEEEAKPSIKDMWDGSDASRYRMGIGIGPQWESLYNGDGVKHRGLSFEVEAGVNLGFGLFKKAFFPLSARYSFDQVKRDLNPGESKLRRHSFQGGFGVGGRINNNFWLSFMFFIGGGVQGGKCHSGTEDVRVPDAMGNFPENPEKVRVDCDGQSGILANGNSETVTAKISNGVNITPEVAAAFLHGGLEVAVQIPISTGGSIPFEGDTGSSSQEQPFRTAGVGVKVKVFPGGIVDFVKNRKNKGSNNRNNSNSTNAAQTASAVSSVDLQEEIQVTEKKLKEINESMVKSYNEMIEEVTVQLPKVARKSVKKYEGKDKKEKQANKNAAVEASVKKIVENAKKIAISYEEAMNYVVALEETINETESVEEKQKAIEEFKVKGLDKLLVKVRPAVLEMNDGGELTRQVFPESLYDIMFMTYQQTIGAEINIKDLYEGYKNKNGSTEIEFPDLQEPQPYDSPLFQ